MNIGKDSLDIFKHIDPLVSRWSLMVIGTDYSFICVDTGTGLEEITKRKQ